jgi:hypothetical protein
MATKSLFTTTATSTNAHGIVEKFEYTKENHPSVVKIIDGVATIKLAKGDWRVSPSTIIVPYGRKVGGQLERWFPANRISDVQQGSDGSVTFKVSEGFCNGKLWAKASAMFAKPAAKAPKAPKAAKPAASAVQAIVALHNGATEPKAD